LKIGGCLAKLGNQSDLYANQKLETQTMTKIQSLKPIWDKFIGAVTTLSPIVDLGVRLWVANVFFTSGMTKIQNWSSTVSLFENEYAVPILPPEIAAYVGTATELTLPIFLTLGLITRPAAIALFVFNIIAALTYPDISALGIKDHQVWGLLMLVTIVHGPGQLSLDHWLKSKFFK
jgi:putative oxidoreductase